MLIDWFTVGAQALNFIILIWLMKRFLYKPILNAIDAREARIAKELAEAAATKATAEKERDDFQHKNEAFDQERAALLSKATDEAKAERERLLEAARATAEAQKAKSQESLKNEAADFKQALRRKTQTEVFAVARQTLGDLASTGLEQRVAIVFIDRLRALDSDAKNQLARALKAATDSALVRSAFDLSPEQHAEIQRAINETVSADVPLRFETAPELVGGIELTTPGQKVAWSIDHYLGALEKSVGDLIADKASPTAVRP
ncbi:MAG: F0F1 ATP synthase subunit B [Opitutus sp.]